MDIQALKNAGIDYDAGLERFLNDEELYEAVLRAFVADDVLDRATKAFEQKDYGELFKAVHEAKGSSGNADFTCLYKEASALAALLRQESFAPQEVEVCFRSFERAYALLKDGIKKALEG